MMDSSEEYKDYYAVLGVPRHADREAISKAYRRLIKSVHPDTRRGKPDPATGWRVAELVEAWKVLGDSARRATYDKARRARLDHPPNGADPERPLRQDPLLEIAPELLDLGTVRRGKSATGHVRLGNRGGRATALEIIGSTAEWISVSRAESGQASFSLPLTMAIRVDTRGLAPGRQHRAELAFRLANQVDGSRSGEERLTVTVAVAPPLPPHLEVRPGDWVVKPCECEGAPHSLMLHLFLGNRGGGAVAGSLHGPPWLRITPERFGPLPEGSGPLRVLIELDCEEWEKSGWKDGAVWVVTDGGDLREVPLVAWPAREGPGDHGVPGWLPWYPLALAALATGPLLTLLVGVAGANVPSGALTGTALSLVGVLSLPALLGRTRRREALSEGPRAETWGWGLGPLGGGARLWLVALAWSALGAMLGLGLALRLPSPASSTGIVWVGSAAGLAAGLSVSLREGLLFALVRGLGLLRIPYQGILSSAVVAAWGVMGALALQTALGEAREGYLWLGGALGWLVGSGVIYARNPVLPSGWRRGIAGLLWGLVPILTGATGLVVGLSVAVEWIVGAGWLAWTLPTLRGGSSSSALLALPAASLASSLMAAAACAGLLLGFGLGLASLLPTIDAQPLPQASWRSGRALSAALRQLIIEMVASHAEFDIAKGDIGDNREGVAERGRLWEAHWSTIAVGGLGALLLVYAAARLLLAIVAVLGILVG